MPFWFDGLSGKGGVCLWQNPLAAESRWHSSSCRHQRALRSRAADGRRTCGRAAQETRGESVSSSDCGERAGRTRARRGMFGAVPCRVDLRSRSASLDAAQEAVTAGAAHRHRSVLKRRSCRHRGGDRARRAHDKTCVRDGGELGRGWWAENASRYGRAGPRRAPRRNRALRTNRRNRRTDSPSPNTTRGPPPPVSQSENSDCTICFVFLKRVARCHGTPRGA